MIWTSQTSLPQIPWLVVSFLNISRPPDLTESIFDPYYLKWLDLECEDEGSRVNIPVALRSILLILVGKNIHDGGEREVTKIFVIVELFKVAQTNSIGFHISSAGRNTFMP